MLSVPIFPMIGLRILRAATSGSEAFRDTDPDQDEKQEANSPRVTRRRWSLRLYVSTHGQRDRDEREVYRTTESGRGVRHTRSAKLQSEF